MADTYGKIRVDNGIKRIEVNDQGDTIEVSATMSFYSRLKNLYVWLKEAAAKAQEIAEEMPEDASVEASIEHIDKVAEIFQEFTVKNDELFGAGASKKIYGDGIPDIDMIDSFFEQLLPIVEKLAQDRNKQHAQKYGRSRGKKK